MPTPHFDAVLAALREPWFFPETRARTTAAAQGAAYALKLKTAFDARADKADIESALGLGFYAVHTQANKQKRLTLRAVLAAEMLMKKRQPAEIPGLRRLHESLPLDGLKRAFVNLFPVGHQHDPKRVLWNPDSFTDPILLPDLMTKQDWTGKPVPSYMFLVHMSDDPDDPAKLLWPNPVAELARYSGSSLTLMSNEKPYTYTNRRASFSACRPTTSS